MLCCGGMMSACSAALQTYMLLRLTSVLHSSGRTMSPYTFVMFLSCEQSKHRAVQVIERRTLVSGLDAGGLDLR